MGVLLLFLVTIAVPSVLGQDQADCYGAGSVAGAAIGAFIAALILVAAAYYFRKLYWKSRKGKHLVFSTDPESVKDEFAFDNPGFRQEERNWRHEAPTLPIGGKPHVLHAEFTKPEQSKDDLHLQRAQVRKVKLWARDFTGLGLTCGGGAREGVHVNSVLRSGPAAAAKLQPGDKIKSIKIEFNGTPLEDAVSILSLASPYPVELEVVEGGRASGAGRDVHHPLLKRAGSMGDVNSLEKEGKLLHPPRSPNTSHSNNSTLETKNSKAGLKKIITDKIITSTSLERNKKDKKDSVPSTLERENDRNAKHSKTKHSDAPLNKPERTNIRHSSGEVQIIQPENGIAYSVEHSEMQRKEADPKRAMKFGIRVLPPNVPDDGVLKQKNVENGIVAAERKTVDEIDKPEPHPTVINTQMHHENETELKKPVVAKRREKLAPPIPNARTKPIDTEMNTSFNTSKSSDNSVSNLSRGDLNSSGIRRDENGIPQELPQHMMDAANAARHNRKSSSELISEKEKVDHKKDEGSKSKKEEAPKAPAKKSKGKAPSPPKEIDKNKTDDSILEQMKRVYDFLMYEKEHSGILNDSSVLSNRTESSYNTSTPKIVKNKSVSRFEDSAISHSINLSQDDMDDIVMKPFKKESDSLNNFYEDSKSNLSSNLDGHSVISLNQSEKSDKGSTTIELNNSDVTIHSSPLNDTVQSASDDTSILDENERKAASLGDLSRFEHRTKAVKPATGTLERAQSLDISAEDAEINETTLSPKKRKAMSVVESTFFDSGNEDILPDMIDSDKGVVIKHKEPRLSLNIAKTSAFEGLNTFQKNRLKKASEFGNLEDAIVKGSSNSIESDKYGSHDNVDSSHPDLIKENEPHDTSDHLAKRIMDENMKVHLKLVTEFAKSTSDSSNLSSLDHTQELPPTTGTDSSPVKYQEEKVSLSYDTNIPDDMKVSRSSYVNSLERPKSELMKKLLAKNPILNVHIDQSSRTEANISKDNQTPLTDSYKSSLHQPDIVNFDLKASESNTKGYDDFVSNIKVGSNNNTLKNNKKPQEKKEGWSEVKDVQTNNIVTINAEKSNPEEERKSYTKSIEIGEPTMRIVPDVIEGIKRLKEKKENRTLYMEPANMSITMTQEPVQKTVTVNVTEDEFGNQVITQNVEKVSTKYISTKMEAPLQVEQVSVGMIKNPGEISQINLEEGNVKDIDKNILDEIKRQNPNIEFTSDEPSYTRTETIILNTTEMNEDQARLLMDKLKNDPSFMANKTPEELSKLGVRIIRELDDVESTSKDTVEVTKTKYSINSPVSSPTPRDDEEKHKDHITEIQVVTPRTEKMSQKSEIKDKTASRQRAPPLIDPPLSYELDLELLSDFIHNERNHTAKQIADIKKRTKTNSISNDPKKRHSDFDLPRNSHIKFRTTTYESPKGTIITSTDLENRRLSQLDQMALRAQNDQSLTSKPAILAKPSNIPIKQSNDKSKPATVTSKIPVFMSQKSLSQENLSEKTFSLPRSPPPALSSSSGNISVTSIKSSSKSPSGGKFL